jgi:RNA polymerase sigma factor (sigma-70 family)
MEASGLPNARRIALPRPRRLLRALPDAALVARARDGDERAFEVIWDRHHLEILSFCRHMLGSREDAEDAVQHTFAAAHRSMAGSEREIALKAWLYAIARNRCLSVLRAGREEPVEEVEVSTAGLVDEVHRREDLRHLLHDLGRLPEHQRAALVLSELGDLSHPEIAGVLGCEVAQVKSYVFQARSALIDARKARDIPCAEIREQLATLSGGALRRRTLRRHLNACEGCREFRDELRVQRGMLAVVLPVVPTLGLKETALAALGLGGGGGAGALATGGAAKLAVVAALAGGGAGGVVVVEEAGRPDAAQSRPAAVSPQAAAPALTPVAARPPALVGLPPAERDLMRGKKQGRRGEIKPGGRAEGRRKAGKKQAAHGERRGDQAPSREKEVRGKSRKHGSEPVAARPKHKDTDSRAARPEGRAPKRERSPRGGKLTAAPVAPSGDTTLGSSEPGTGKTVR